LLLLPAVAAAEATRYRTALDVRVEDPERGPTITALTEFLHTIRRTALDACWKKPDAMTMKLTFDGGKVTKVDEVVAAEDPQTAACVTRALRTIALANRAGGVIATCTLRAEPAPSSPPPPSSKASQKAVVDSIIDRGEEPRLTKFTGLKGNGGITFQGSSGGGPGSATTRPGDADRPPAPPPRAAMIGFGSGPTGEFGKRSAELIQRVVVSRAGVFRACYQKALRRTPGIAGTVVVVFSIEPEGTVASLLHTASAALLPEEVVGCIKTNIHRLRFDATDAPSKVSFPFVFSDSP
jgi:hypothetical protein